MLQKPMPLIFGRPIKLAASVRLDSPRMMPFLARRRDQPRHHLGQGRRGSASSSHSSMTAHLLYHRLHRITTTPPIAPIAGVTDAHRLLCHCAAILSAHRQAAFPARTSRPPAIRPGSSAFTRRIALPTGTSLWALMACRRSSEERQWRGSAAACPIAARVRMIRTANRWRIGRRHRRNGPARQGSCMGTVDKG